MQFKSTSSDVIALGNTLTFPSLWPRDSRGKYEDPNENYHYSKWRQSNQSSSTQCTKNASPLGVRLAIPDKGTSSIPIQVQGLLQKQKQRWQTHKLPLKIKNANTAAKSGNLQEGAWRRDHRLKLREVTDSPKNEGADVHLGAASSHPEDTLDKEGMMHEARSRSPCFLETFIT